jgi:hypothetical protein
MWGECNRVSRNGDKKKIICLSAVITFSLAACSGNNKIDEEYIRTIFAERYSEVEKEIFNVNEASGYECKKSPRDDIVSGVNYDFEISCYFEVNCDAFNLTYNYHYYILDNSIIQEGGLFLKEDSIAPNPSCYKGTENG